jgi:hypothetical protein
MNNVSFQKPTGNNLEILNRWNLTLSNPVVVAAPSRETAGLSLQERAAAYNKTFPKYPPLKTTLIEEGIVVGEDVFSPLVVEKGWLYGFWCIGREWKKNPSPIYGGYPGNYLKRIRSLFPDVLPEKTLHLFKGAVEPLPGERSVDVVAKWNPTYLADVEEGLPMIPDQEFSLILADPPYSVEDCLHYRTPMINRKKVMRVLHRILALKGTLVWLDQVRPMYRKEDWEQWGTIGIVAGTNCRVRCVSLFRKV